MTEAASRPLRLCVRAPKTDQRDAILIGSHSVDVSALRALAPCRRDAAVFEQTAEQTRAISIAVAEAASGASQLESLGPSELQRETRAHGMQPVSKEAAATTASSRLGLGRRLSRGLGE